MVSTAPSEQERREQALALVKGHHYLCIQCGMEVLGYAVEIVDDRFVVVSATCLNSHPSRFWSDGTYAGLYTT